MQFGCLALGLGLTVGLASGQQPPPDKKKGTQPPPAPVTPPPPPVKTKFVPQPVAVPAPAPAPVPVVRPLPGKPTPKPVPVINTVVNPAVNNNWAGYNIPMSNPWTTNVGPWAAPAFATPFSPYAATPFSPFTTPYSSFATPYSTPYSPFIPVSTTLPLMSSWNNPLQFSTGLNNPYWGNSSNPFATLSSPLTFAPGLNSPYWAGGIQQSRNQAASIIYQQMMLQQWYQSMSYFQNPYSTPYYGMTAPVFPLGGGIAGAGAGRFLDAGPLGAPGVPQPLDGMAAIGAGFPVGLGR
jgi:hypothetical protein